MEKEGLNKKFQPTMVLIEHDRKFKEHGGSRFAEVEPDMTER